MARSRIGLDPSGNTDRGPTAVWSAWDRPGASATEGWREIQVEALAAGRIMTLLLDFEQRDASNPPPGNQWRINCFDAVEIEDLDREPPFDRGDCKDDRSLDLADPIFLLFHLYQGGQTPGCFSACDSNDDGGLDLSDAIAVLEHLFTGGAPPPAPRGSCGQDPSPDGPTEAA